MLTAQPLKPHYLYIHANCSVAWNRQVSGFIVTRCDLVTAIERRCASQVNCYAPLMTQSHLRYSGNAFVSVHTPLSPRYHCSATASLYFVYVRNRTVTAVPLHGPRGVCLFNRNLLVSNIFLPAKCTHVICVHFGYVQPKRSVLPYCNWTKLEVVALHSYIALRIVGLIPMMS